MIPITLWKGCAIMSRPENIVMIGATSGIALACARLWAAEGKVAFTLVGRDAQKLDDVAKDLRVRGAAAKTRVVDFHDPRAIAALAEETGKDGAPDIVLIAHGLFSDQKKCQQDLAAARTAMEINAISPALFAEAFAGVMEKAGRGRLALIGSVAGDRGRRSHYVYGASKGFVERYMQGLRHRLWNTGVSVTLIKPGPTDTPMTAQLKQKGAALAPVEDVAAACVKGIARGRAVVYAPARWRPVMLVIRNLPEFVFNRMNI